MEWHRYGLGNYIITTHIYFEIYKHKYDREIIKVQVFLRLLFKGKPIMKEIQIFLRNIFFQGPTIGF